MIAPAQRILSAVSAAYEVDCESIFSTVRKPRVVEARQAAMWLCHDVLGWSSGRIGELFQRDHSTVLHAIKVVEARRQKPEGFGLDGLRKDLTQDLAIPMRRGGRQDSIEPMIEAFESGVARELADAVSKAIRRDPARALRVLADLIEEKNHV